jgi:hypothetical protein
MTTRRTSIKQAGTAGAVVASLGPSLFAQPAAPKKMDKRWRRIAMPSSATDSTSAAARHRVPGVIVFDGLHRPVLVRFSGCARRIADETHQGFAVERGVSRRMNVPVDVEWQLNCLFFLST